MNGSYTLEQLALFDRCLFPGDFRDDLVDAGLDESTAFAVSRFIIDRRRIIYAATKSTGSVGIIEIYQEFITCKEIIDAIEKVVYDFCNK